MKIKNIVMNLVIAAGLTGLVAQPAQAATTLGPSAKISFTFDDGLTSAYTQAAPTLKKYGLSGTSYVITDCVGMTKAPNTCRADENNTYMTWAQIQALQSTYGWEIGSHSVSHPCLADSAATDPDNCQANLLTATELNAQIAGSKTALASHGITATSFALPYGGYNNAVLAEVAKFYSNVRLFREQGDNAWPSSEYYLRTLSIQEGVTTVAKVKAAIDSAIANKTWLILSFHDIRLLPSKNADDYQYGLLELDQIAAYVKSKQTAGATSSINMSQGVLTGDTNLLPNSTFDNGVADGWTTDAPANIVKNSASHGSYPSPTNSLEFTATNRNIHLFSPKVTVNPQQTYLVKSFLNVETNTGGSFSYYIDEYDQFGNWVSGQYKKSESGTFVENINFNYKPTSSRVAQASLQMIVTANSGIHAYVDNAQWYSTNQFTEGTTPSPTTTNLMPNGGFEAGLASGWRTDDAAAVIADATGMGSGASPQNSIKMTASTHNVHLFSPRVAVDGTKSYTISNYLKLQQISSGVFAVYIDEYDAAGNWISGQYKLEKSAPMAGVIGFTYNPSTTNVKSASVQYIVVGNSGITAYVDAVSMVLN